MGVAGVDYLDFDLRIEPKAAGGYRVRVIDPDGNVVASTEAQSPKAGLRVPALLGLAMLLAGLIGGLPWATALAAPLVH